MTSLDFLIVAAFIAYAVGSGLRNRRRASRNLDEYFLANRSLPGWQAGLSMAATQFAADTPLLVTGLIATAGIFALWQLWIYALAFLLMGFVLAPGWRRAGVLTDAELTEVRYGRRPATVLRGIKAVYFGTIFNCTVLAFVFFAAAKIAEPFLLWHAWLPDGLFLPVVDLVQWIGVPLTIGPPDDPEVWTYTASNLISILLLLAVATFYSTTGGLRSVVATDVLQLAVMLIGTAAFATVVVSEAGGLGAVTERLHALFRGGGPGGILPEQILAFTPDRARDASAAVLMLFGLQWLIQINADGTGYLAQRSMACRSDTDAKTAAVVFTFTQVLLRSLLWIPLGLGLLVLFSPDQGLAAGVGLDAGLLQADREATYVRGMAELLPAGVKGLMVTGMLAALASTVDTHLNWGASYWTNDIYKRFVCQLWLGREPSGRSLVWVARGANVLLVGIRARDHDAAHFHQRRLADQPAARGGDGRGAHPALDLVAHERLGGDRGGACVDCRGSPADGLRRRQSARAPAAARGGVLHDGGAGRHPSRRPRGPRAGLVAFYRKSPAGRLLGGRSPGSAGAAADDGPRRLGRALAATGSCALSVFCLLVGIGSWLAGSPAPAWFPFEAAWRGGLIAAGVALAPLWYRLGYRDRRALP